MVISLLEQAGTETELEESDEMLAAKTALALAQMNMGQPEVAEQIETLVADLRVGNQRSPTDRLRKTHSRTHPWATQQIVAAQLERIQASVLQLHYQADPGHYGL